MASAIHLVYHTLENVIMGKVVTFRYTEMRLMKGVLKDLDLLSCQAIVHNSSDAITFRI